MPTVVIVQKCSRAESMIRAMEGLGYTFNHNTQAFTFVGQGKPFVGQFITAEALIERERRIEAAIAAAGGWPAYVVRNQLLLALD